MLAEGHKFEIKQDSHFLISRASDLTTLLPKLISSPRPFMNMSLGVTKTQDEPSSEIHYLCDQARFLNSPSLKSLFVNRDHKKTSQRWL